MSDYILRSSLCSVPLGSVTETWVIQEVQTHQKSDSKQSSFLRLKHLTSVWNTSVFAQEADLLLLLGHILLVFRSQAVRMSGEDEGVTVQAGSILIKHSAGVVDGVVLIISVNDPVVIICGAVRDRSWADELAGLIRAMLTIHVFELSPKKYYKIHFLKYVKIS